MTKKRTTLASLTTALVACVFAANAVSANETEKFTRQSYKQPCAEIAKTAAQRAHDNPGTNPADWYQFSPCVVTYSGPKIPGFYVEKDVIARDNGCSCGSRPQVGQYGDFFKISNDISIHTLNSKKLRFVKGNASKVDWSGIEDYIRSSGEPDVHYWAGEFWKENGDPRRILEYSGPGRSWIIPDGVVVKKPSGVILTSGYEVPKILTKFTILADWYIY